MKAYSLDLRQKVIDAYNRKEGSQRQLAKRFSVSLSFIQDLVKRHCEAGTIAPREHAGGVTAKLNAEQVALVAHLVKEDNDAILVELCERLEQHWFFRILWSRSLKPAFQESSVETGLPRKMDCLALGFRACNPNPRSKSVFCI